MPTCQVMQNCQTIMKQLSFTQKNTNNTTTTLNHLLTTNHNKQLQLKQQQQQQRHKYMFILLCAIMKYNYGTLNSVLGPTHKEKVEK